MCCFPSNTLWFSFFFFFSPLQISTEILNLSKVGNFSYKAPNISFPEREKQKKKKKKELDVDINALSG